MSRGEAADQTPWHAGPSFGRARVADFVAIAALDRAAWSGGRFPERIPDGEHVWRVWVEEALVLVARHGDEVVGAIVAFPTDSGRLFIHKIMVDAAHRRRGIGQRLFEVLLEEVDEHRHDTCYLTVDPTHARDIARYEKLGFVEKRFVSGYYREDEDRLVLTRPAVAGRGRGHEAHGASRPAPPARESDE